MKKTYHGISAAYGVKNSIRLKNAVLKVFLFICFHLVINVDNCRQEGSSVAVCLAVDLGKPFTDDTVCV